MPNTNKTVISAKEQLQSVSEDFINNDHQKTVRGVTFNENDSCGFRVFKNVTFDRCIFHKGFIFRVCEFESCTFYDCKFDDMCFNCCSFDRLTDITNCSFTDVTIQHCEVTGTRVELCTFYDTTIADGVLDGITAFNVSVTNLHGEYNTWCSHDVLEDVSIQGLTSTCVTMSETQFLKVTLKDADWTAPLLQMCYFDDSDSIQGFPDVIAPLSDDVKILYAVLDNKVIHEIKPVGPIGGVRPHDGTVALERFTFVDGGPSASCSPDMILSVTKWGEVQDPRGVLVSHGSMVYLKRSDAETYLGSIQFEPEIEG